MIKMKLKQKGQGALEYLILIGAAILVAVIVVSVLLGTSNSSKQTSEDTTKSYQELVTNTIIPPTIISVSCTDENATYVINESVTSGVTRYCVVIDGDVNISSSVCAAPTNNTVIITNLSLTSGEHNMSLVAQKGNAYSAPTTPSPECTVD